MPTYGEWQDDSVPFWKATGSGSTTSATSWTSEARDNDWTQWGAPASAAWNGQGTISEGEGASYGSITFNLGQPNSQSIVSWTQAWVTVTRYDSTVTYGILPPAVGSGSGNNWTFTDPNVVGIEWEADPFPLSQRATVGLGTDTQNIPTDSIQPGLRLSVISRPPATMTQFMDARGISNLGAVATMTPATVSDRPVVTFDLPPDQAGTLVLSVIDDWTMLQVAPEENELGFLRSWSPFTANWEAEYAPRYRLLYADPARYRPAHNRVVQRGNDGLGVTGGRRIIGTRTIQSSNRRGTAIR